MTLTSKHTLGTFKYAALGACAALAASLLFANAAPAKDSQTHHHPHRTHQAAVPAPATMPVYRPWYGPDPTRGPGMDQLREYQNEGRCVIDEGYGHWTPCSNE